MCVENMQSFPKKKEKQSTRGRLNVDYLIVDEDPNVCT